MRTSQNGIDLVKRFEGFSPVAYLCPAGVWTIGYGHTAGVREGDSVDEDTAEKIRTLLTNIHEDRNSRFDGWGNRCLPIPIPNG